MLDYLRILAEALLILVIVLAGVVLLMIGISYLVEVFM